MSSTSVLYEPLIERNLAAIPDAIRTFRDAHGSDETFLAVARFAVLAYAPSQHAKHALLSCLATHDLRDRAGERFDDLVTECAIYASGSRQPWSEPPILNPPAVDGTPATFEDLTTGERWLAARLQDANLERDYFAAASHDFEDLGHKLIISAAAWRLASILGGQGRYATLRVGVWEDVAYEGPRYEERGNALDERALLAGLIDGMVAERGSIESAHAIFLFDAALATGSAEISKRVRDYLTDDLERRPGFSPAAGLKPALRHKTPIPVYRLARDYGQCLKAHAVAQRLASRFPDAPVDRIVAAAHDNLEHAPSFEEWSFA